MARAFFCNNKTLVFQVTNYAFDGADSRPENTEERLTPLISCLLAKVFSQNGRLKSSGMIPCKEYE